MKYYTNRVLVKSRVTCTVWMLRESKNVKTNEVLETDMIWKKNNWKHSAYVNLRQGKPFSIRSCSVLQF